MNKTGKAKEITLIGAIFLVVIGIIFLSSSSSDSTGVTFWIGIIFLVVGILSVIAILIKIFK